MMENSVWSAISRMRPHTRRACVNSHSHTLEPWPWGRKAFNAHPFQQCPKIAVPCFMYWPSSLCQVNWPWSASVIHQEIWHHFSDFYVRTVLLKAGVGHSLELSNTTHRQVFELVPISYVIQCEAPWVRHALAPAAWISTAFDLSSSFYEVENLI